MGPWSRAEIEDAFADYQRKAAEAGRSRRLAGMGRPVHRGRHLHRAPFRHVRGAGGHLRLDQFVHGRLSRAGHARVPHRVVHHRRGAGLGGVPGMEPDAGPGRRVGPPGVQLHPPQVRRRRAVVLRGGHLQPDAVRGHGGRVGGGHGSDRRTTRPAVPSFRATVLRCGCGRTTTGEDRSPLVGGRAGRRPPSGTPTPIRRRPPSTTPWPPGSTISMWLPSTAGPRSCSGLLIPAVRDRLFVACKTLRHSGDGVRAQLEESLRLLRCDHFDLYQLHAVTDLAGVGCPVRGRRGHPGRPRRGPLPVGGHHRPRADRSRRPPRGAAPLRPRHGDVPGQPPAVVGCHLPAGRRGPAGPRRRARRGGDGHQGGRRPTLGRPAADAGYLVRALHRTGRGGTRGRFALSTPGVHAFCTPGDTGVLRTALDAAGRFAPMSDVERQEAVASVAHEPSIFPMPAA